MQCTSFIPVYYQPRSVNGTAGGFPWHLLNGNANYGDQRGFNSSLQPSTVYQYSSYDKDAMRQIIQNHEATFRYQVQELHRLYKRQTELMDEMRTREAVAQHMQTPESIQCLSQPRSDISQTSHTPSWLLGDHSHSKLPVVAVNNIHQCPSFVTNHIPEQKKSSSCNEVDILPLKSDENQKGSLNLKLPADEYCASNAPNELIHVQRTSDLNSGGMNCLIDLNEPVQLESLSSNSTGSFAAHSSHVEIIHSDSPCGSEEAKPETSILAGLDVTNPSMAIDLNSMPVNCFSETEATLENIPGINNETMVVPDKILETETHIDLTTGAVNEHLKAIKSVGGLGSEALFCPENEERSFRQKLQTSLLSENLEETVKPPLELDVIAAETLLVMSSLTMKSEVAGNSGNRLYWFADIISSTGGNIENDITGDFGTKMMKVSEKNAAGKERDMAEGSLESPQKRRNAGRKPCPKSRKCSNVVSSVKKSTNSILKQPATRSRQGILQSWGRIRKRQGRHRRRTSKFPAIN